MSDAPHQITYEPATWRDARGSIPFGIPDLGRTVPYFTPKQIALAASVSVRAVYEAIDVGEMPGSGRKRGHRHRIDAQAYARHVLAHGLTWLVAPPESA